MSLITPVLMAELDRHGIGECVVTGELPPRRSRRFFHDSGAYRDWRSGRQFKLCRWDRDMRWMLYRGIVPDFVVVPDIVAGGLESLAWSAFWRNTVPAEFPACLAVQDGMTAADVMPHLERYQGLFVGGSLPWKLETSASWVQLAHAHGLRCHIGRVGPSDRVRWARRIHADSIEYLEHRILDVILSAGLSRASKKSWPCSSEPSIPTTMELQITCTPVDPGSRVVAGR